MAFNMDKIKGASSIKTGVKVGAGLLSDVSKNSAVKEMEIIYVLPEQIRKSPKNKGISIERIEELAESIRDVGMLNPPILKRVDESTYELVAGERRCTAVDFLVERKEWDPDRPIRCALFDPDLIDLPLSDEDKEEYVRITENAEQRDMTDGDRLLIMRKLKSLYEKMREKGELSGVKTRTLLAEDLNMSEAAVAQFQKVENVGTEELKEAVLENKIAINAAVKVADLEEKKQKEFVDNIKDGKRATAKDVDTFVMKEKSKKTDKKTKQSTTTEDPDNHVVTKTIFRNDTKDILKIIGDKEVVLDNDEYLRYLKALQALQKVFEKK